MVRLPVEIRADGCLFVSAAAESTPFALVRGGDPAQWDKYLTWIAGAANGYGNFADDAALLDVAVDNPEGKPKRVGLDDWLMANKEKATANGKAYSHPLFILSPNQLGALDAFVAAAIASYKGGLCGH